VAKYQPTVEYVAGRYPGVIKIFVKKYRKLSELLILKLLAITSRTAFYLRMNSRKAENPNFLFSMKFRNVKFT